MRQRLNRESLALLEPDLPSSLAASDIAVWRKLTQGSARAYLSEYPQAQKLLRDAEDLAEAGHADLLGEVALRKGTLAYLRGDATAAESSYRKALQMARAENDSFLEAASLGSLGLTATRQEHYDESIDWNRAALRVSQAAGAEDSVSYILGNMAWSYFELGDYERSLQLYQQAERASEKTGSVGAQIDWRIDIGIANYYLRDYAAAEGESQKALEMARKLDQKLAITRCLNNLSYVAMQKGRLDQAEIYNNEALEVSRVTGNRFDELSSTLIAGLIESGRRHDQEAERLLKKVIGDPAAVTSLRWEAESRLGRVYADAGSPWKAEQEFRRSIGTIEAARSFVRHEEFRMSFLSSAIEFYDDYIDFLAARGRNTEALQVAELGRARTLLDGLGVSPAKFTLPLAGFRPQAVAQRLDAVILSYWLGREHSYLWVIPPSGQMAMITLPPENEITPIVQAYRQALVGPRDVLETGNADGRRLYQLLIGSAKGAIEKAGRVVVIPDGALYELNFETLLAPSPRLHYWLEDVTVTNASSLLLLAAAPGRERRVPSEKLLLIGDPISPAEDYPPLPQAKQEIERIGRQFDATKRTVLSGAQETPAAYLESHPDRYSLIHFVAHGIASRTSPLDSAIVLSNPGGSFKLYARDIIQQPIHADLVTVSSCFGAGTRIYAGEGLAGLSWAFLRAGANNVVGALWEVSDLSTPQLMDDFYGEIRQGRAPAIALRGAKLKLLHSNSVYKKPFYWAPFQLYAGL